MRFSMFSSYQAKKIIKKLKSWPDRIFYGFLIAGSWLERFRSLGIATRKNHPMFALLFQIVFILSVGLLLFKTVGSLLAKLIKPINEWLICNGIEGGITTTSIVAGVSILAAGVSILVTIALFFKSSWNLNDTIILKQKRLIFLDGQLKLRSYYHRYADVYGLSKNSKHIYNRKHVWGDSSKWGDFKEEDVKYPKLVKYLKENKSIWDEWDRDIIDVGRGTEFLEVTLSNTGRAEASTEIPNIILKMLGKEFIIDVEPLNYLDLTERQSQMNGTDSFVKLSAGENIVFVYLMQDILAQVKSILISNPLKPEKFLLKIGFEFKNAKYQPQKTKNRIIWRYGGGFRRKQQVTLVPLFPTMLFLKEEQQNIDFRLNTNDEDPRKASSLIAKDSSLETKLRFYHKLHFDFFKKSHSVLGFNNIDKAAAVAYFASFMVVSKIAKASSLSKISNLHLTGEEKRILSEIIPNKKEQSQILNEIVKVLKKLT